MAVLVADFEEGCQTVLVSLELTIAVADCFGKLTVEDLFWNA